MRKGSKPILGALSGLVALWASGWGSVCWGPCQWGDRKCRMKNAVVSLWPNHLLLI